MPIYILVTGPSMRDTTCFASAMASKLNFGGLPTTVLEQRKVAQIHLNKATGEIFGEGYLADGEWLTAYMENMRDKDEIDWPTLLAEAIQREMELGYQIVIIPDITYMTDLTALYLSSYGYVRLERDGPEDISLSTTRDSDQTYSIGDETDVIEAGLSYAEDIFVTMQVEDDIELFDDDFLSEKPKKNDISMFG